MIIRKRRRDADDHDWSNGSSGMSNQNKTSQLIFNYIIFDWICELNAKSESNSAISSVQVIASLLLSQSSNLNLILILIVILNINLNDPI